MFHNIHLNELTHEGKFFEGEIRNDPFALKGKDDPKFVPPVRFALTVSIDGPDVIIEGSLSARFEMECARCGQWFPYEVALDDYYSQEPRDGAATLDLTAHIREDILLALPGYPRCEESNVENRTCPAAGQFAEDGAFAPLSEEETQAPQHPDVWNVLDKIAPNPGAPPRSKS